MWAHEIRKATTDAKENAEREYFSALSSSKFWKTQTLNAEYFFGGDEHWQLTRFITTDDERESRSKDGKEV